MQYPLKKPYSNLHAKNLRTELRRLLDTPLEFHRKAILASHGSLDEVLAGDRPVVIYPAARMASSAAALLQARGVDVRGFSDKNQALWGRTLNGLPVVPPSEIAVLAASGAVLVASSLHDSDIREYLVSSGCTNSYSMPYLNYCLPEVFSSREYFKAIEAPFRPNARGLIFKLFDLLADDISRHVLVSKIRYYLTLDKGLLDGVWSSQPTYFDPEIIVPVTDEIVVDGGAFNGDTLQQFLRITDGQFQRYYAFEPDPGVFENLRRLASFDSGRIECVRAGLSDRTGTLNFSVTGSVDSAVVTADGQPTESLPVVDLDSYFGNCEPPSMIKMDIEGSERAALEGARGLINECEPSLAVSTYHFPRDLWEIPLLIVRLNPGSRLYLRHYTREIDDTVCYAVPGNRVLSATHTS